MDQVGDERSLLGGKPLTTDLGGAHRIDGECELRRGQRAHRGGGDLWILIEQPLRGCQSAEGIVETARRTISATHVKHNGPGSAPHRHLSAHAVGPESIDETVLERTCRSDTEVDAGAL